MMGRLGFDIVVSQLSADDLAFCQKAIATYNSLKPLILQGEQYRLQSPWGNDAASVSYVSPDATEAVVFAYQVSNRYESGTKTPIKLKGLDVAASYKIEEINVYPGKKPVVETAVFSGDFLMKVGVNPNVNTTNTSVVLKLTKI